MTTASICPVCGQRLSSGFVCSECGAIPSLRGVRASGPSAAASVTSRFIDICRRGFSALTSAVSKLLPEDRRWAYGVVALLATAILVAAVAGIFGGPNSTADRRPRSNRERAEAAPAAVLDRQSQSQRSEERRWTAEPLEVSQARSPYAGSTALGMIAAIIGAALLCAFAVASARRRRQHRSADDSEPLGTRRMTYASAVAAAFCFGLASALAVILIAQSRTVLPLPAFAVIPREHTDPWRREASTLKERLSVLDARLASLEATRTGEGSARQQPTRTAAIDDVQREAPQSGPGRGARRSEAVGRQEGAAVSNAPVPPAHLEASVKPPIADVLRPPLRPARVREGLTVGDRVWNDILSDWDNVKRSIRDLFPRDYR
jgi:hypothetical protein